MQSSGKMTSSAPSPRARRVHAAIFAVLPSTSPTVGLIWARARRTKVGLSRPAAPSSRLRGSFSLHAEDFEPRERPCPGAKVRLMRSRFLILAAAVALVGAALPGNALAAHPGEPGIRPSRTPWGAVAEAADSPDCGAHF